MAGFIDTTPKEIVEVDETNYDEFPIEQTDNSVKLEDGDQSNLSQEPDLSDLDEEE